MVASQDKNSEMYVAAAKLLKDLRREKWPRDDDDEQETQIVCIIWFKYQINEVLMVWLLNRMNLTS